MTQNYPALHGANLLSQLFQTVEAVGIDKTVEVLKSAQYQEIKFADPDVEFVVTQVAIHFDIPSHEIVYGNGRKNDRKLAIGFCAHYLQTVYARNMDEVKDHIKKDLSLCWKYAKLITKLSPRHHTDRKYLEIKDKLDVIFVKK